MCPIPTPCRKISSLISLFLNTPMKAMHIYSFFFFCFYLMPRVQTITLAFCRCRELKAHEINRLLRSREPRFSKIERILASQDINFPIFQLLTLTFTVVCSVVRQLLLCLSLPACYISEVLCLIPNYRWYDNKVCKTVWNGVLHNPSQTPLKVYWTLSRRIVSLTTTRIIVLKIKHCLRAFPHWS